MGYIAKALVRIEDANIRHRTFDKFVRMGYEMGLSDPYGIHPYILMDNNTVNIRAINAVDKEYGGKPPIRSEGFIDCNAHAPNGTEEEAKKLFLELAQMRDDLEDQQWFIGLKDGSFRKCIGSHRYRQLEGVYWRRATPLEVAKAFRDGRIEL